MQIEYEAGVVRTVGFLPVIRPPSVASKTSFGLLTSAVGATRGTALVVLEVSLTAPSVYSTQTDRCSSAMDYNYFLSLYILHQKNSV